MKKTDDHEMNKGQAGQELAETAADNTGIDNADTSQSDELRAYVPAGPAMALAPSPEEEPYYEEDYREEDENEYDDDSAVNDIARDMDPESASELLHRYAEQDRLDQESEEGATYEEEPEGDPDTASTEDESQGQSDVDMKLVEETVKTINSMYRKNVDNGKIEIGELLLDNIYKGNVEEAMSTNPQKHKTFSKILERSDLLVEPKTLGSWVRAAAAKRGLKKRLINLPNLTTYHYVELATVRDVEERTKFAKQAELKGWSVKALREEIRKTKSTDKPELDTLKEDMEKSLHQYKDLSVEDKLNNFASDLDSIKKAYPPEKAMKLLPGVKTCLANVRATEQLLKEFHGSLRAIVKEAMEPLSD
jgi:hypothetical protein